jgi:LytS/YehU family sensor histidine kinase
MGADYVPLEKDINSIEDYLRIEHLRFGDKFDYEIVVDQMIDKQGTEVSPGIAQPFIENAIWHGVRALTNRKGFIRVSFEVNDETSIRCIIEDDGIGRQASLSGKQNNSVTHKSKGIGIVSERLQITGKINNAHYNLVISDLHQGKNEPGTRVVVDIPIKREWL